MNGEKDTRLNSASLLASPKTLEGFSDDVKHLWCPRTSVPVLERPPSPLTFHREYASKSMPCIIRNGVLNSDGSCLSLTLDVLVTSCHDVLCEQGEIMLTVDVTPDGHGDCVRTVSMSQDETTRRMFVKPQEQEMNITEFRDRLRSRRRDNGHSSSHHLETDESGKAIFPTLETHHCQPNDENDGTAEDASSSCNDRNEVLYYSRQNDCLRTELRPLFDSGLFPETIDFAEEAFGGVSPDAVNLWIGNEQAVSSMHKDHYENLFYVLSGEKVFTLCPPADAPFLYQSEFDSGTFCQKQNGEWAVREDQVDEVEDSTSESVSARVKWIEGDVEPLVEDKEAFQHQNQHPLLSLAHPIRVHVKAGEMLYVPALWFHRVTQTCETVGINYWYDMQFDSPAWCYFNLLQQLQVVEPETIDKEQS